MEVAAGRVRTHVADAIGEERLEPETGTAAKEESGSTELDEAAATAEAAKEKKLPPPLHWLPICFNNSSLFASLGGCRPA